MQEKLLLLGGLEGRHENWEPSLNTQNKSSALLPLGSTIQIYKCSRYTTAYFHRNLPLKAPFSVRCLLSATV